MIHLTGPISDVDVQLLLAQHYCRTLQDAAFKDLGAERRGRDLWLVLAAPRAPRIAGAGRCRGSHSSHS
jgi:hypothetical protein